MLTTTQQQFLELLRAGLWNTPADPTRFGPDTDWKAIYRISREQTVTGIIADALETLPPSQRPPLPVAQRFIVDKINIARTHTILNHVLNTVVAELNRHHIPHILLKGQGVAQNYPNPTSRTCGDIDLYVGEDNYPQACDIILGIPGAQDGPECEHHRHIDLNGVTIEVHRKADVMEPESIDRKFQKWTKQQLDRNFGRPENLSIWDNAGTAISRPTPLFDSIFILSHMFRHMVHGGVGFRQLCDWTMYMNARHNAVAPDELAAILEATNLTKVWQVFGAAATSVLGLSPDALPIPAKATGRQTEAIIRQIFISGNFGQFDKNKKDESRTTYLKGKLRSFRFRLRRTAILLPIFPKYISINFIGWITGATRRLASHQ